MWDTVWWDAEDQLDEYLAHTHKHTKPATALASVFTKLMSQIIPFHLLIPPLFFSFPFLLSLSEAQNNKALVSTQSTSHHRLRNRPLPSHRLYYAFAYYIWDYNLSFIYFISFYSTFRNRFLQVHPSYVHLLLHYHDSSCCDDPPLSGGTSLNSTPGIFTSPPLG